MKDYRETIRDSYNNNASYRDQETISPWKQEELDVFCQQMKEKGGNRILDLGAGSGAYALYMQNLGFEVTCIDLSSEMIGLCKKRGLQGMVMDFYDLQFEKDYYDGIWALNSLLHVPKNHLSIVLKEVKRVLKKTGLFYMGVYGGRNSEGIWEEDFYEPKRFFSFYKEADIKGALEPYFIIERFSTKTVPDNSFDFQSIWMRKI